MSDQPAGLAVTVTQSRPAVASEHLYLVTLSCGHLFFHAAGADPPAAGAPAMCGLPHGDTLPDDPTLEKLAEIEANWAVFSAQECAEMNPGVAFGGEPCVFRTYDFAPLDGLQAVVLADGPYTVARLVGWVRQLLAAREAPS